MRRAWHYRSAAALVIAVAVVGWSLAPGRSVVASSEPASAGPAAVVPAAPGDAHIKLTLSATGLSSPVFAIGARDGSGRVFIVEKTGKIRIQKSGKVLKTPFLDISSSVSRGAEQGLLGLAFHPNFKSIG